MAVVVGVDGAGRTHRLRALAPPGAVWVTPDRPAVPDTAPAVVVDDPHRLDDATLRALSDVARRAVLGSAAFAAFFAALVGAGASLSPAAARASAS